ncbi:uncharacterized protein EV420DRAFT_1267139 [Desarmillaria tabescens]|uniref:CigA protein n=1 Tax=Armillaria tabescens TaxID=1929756 RepID=A0AA39N8J8_ARMTA|nr:uncharacterized protein EV420DRAFT_1267139 [Desarmillaria tabescens]KAK0461017.1 hypothetical protein EV420DRAFT_1267139 [Desarmillaria tabescens]
MVPKHLFPARTGESSPSITLEKGAYRMRAPAHRPFGTQLFTSTPIPPVTTRHQRRAGTSNGRWVALIMLLACASIVSFGVAYHLFLTRWDLLGHNRFRHNADSIQVVAFNSSLHLPDANEKFLAYLPHSGFHNQRIALENALTLAYMLNRTLIVPPIRLGSHPIRYFIFDTLAQFLSLSGKEGLRHCARLPRHVPIPPECADYLDYTHIPWDWLVNLTDIQKHQRLIHRWDLTNGWIHDRLGILQNETHTLKDNSAYHFRFTDRPINDSMVGDKYKKNIHIRDLALYPHRLLQFGSLFGSTRLRLMDPENVHVRGKVRQSMTYASPELVHAATLIERSIPGTYLGAHIRLGDGPFRNRRHENTRLLWWHLVHGILNYSTEDTLALESMFLSPSDPVGRLQIPPDFAKQQRVSLPPPSPNTASRFPCRGIRHTASRLFALNTPLYIATDSNDPTNDPALSLLLRTFPCTFFLEDFPEQTAVLDSLVNEYDGIKLKSFLLSFLDSMVVAKAWQVVGTNGSTFSQFVQDALWTTYHGLDIVQRGR